MLYQYLETFCRVVDEGSFTKAGESLGFSQPTVTKQIHALEQEMGAVLIRRGQRRLQLTPAGEVVYSHARRILNLVQECRSAIKALEQPGHGKLKIGAVFTIALFTLPPVLEEYRQEQPDVTLGCAPEPTSTFFRWSSTMRRTWVSSPSPSFILKYRPFASLTTGSCW